MLYAVVVCLSVRPFDTHRYYTKTAKPMITKQCRMMAQGFQFADAKHLSEIPTGSPPIMAPNRGEVGYNRRFSTNISLYLRNGAR